MNPLRALRDLSGQAAEPFLVFFSPFLQLFFLSVKQVPSLFTYLASVSLGSSGNVLRAAKLSIGRGGE